MIWKSVLMIAEFFADTLLHRHLSCQRQLTTKWKLGFIKNMNNNNTKILWSHCVQLLSFRPPTQAEPNAKNV